MVRGKQGNKNVVWLDSSTEDSHDPRFWPGNVPHNILGRMTPTKVKAVRQLYSSGEYSQAELAEMFGTTGTTINHIVHRITWKWI